MYENFNHDILLLTFYYPDLGSYAADVSGSDPAEDGSEHGFPAVSPGDSASLPAISYDVSGQEILLDSETSNPPDSPDYSQIISGIDTLNATLALLLFAFLFSWIDRKFSAIVNRFAKRER